MGNTVMIAYLLMGIAGVGVLLASFVLVATLMQRSLDKVSLPLETKAGEESKGSGDAEEKMLLTPVETTVVTKEKDPSIVLQEGKYRGGEPARADATGTVSAPAMPVIFDQFDMGVYQVRIGSAQHVGSRKEQQDALCHGPMEGEQVEKRGFLAVVCDGMGGMLMGAEAARVASENFVESYYASVLPVQRALREAMNEANSAVWELCRTDDLTGAGTTLVAVLLAEQGFQYISVGDSHVYLYRKGVLSQLNADHNYLSELLQRVRRGEISRAQALSDPERAHLTSYLGLRKLTLVDRSPEFIEVEDGDRILLASDGLFKVLSPAKIAERLKSFGTTTATELIDEVIGYNYRNQDNITVMIIALDKAPGKG